MEEHILEYTGEELDVKLAEISTKATNTFFTTTIPMSYEGNWYGYGYGAYYALDIPIEGILYSDHPKISVCYDDYLMDEDSVEYSLDNFPNAFSKIKTIMTYDGGITVVIHLDAYDSFIEGNIYLPIQLEVTR